jgi:DNA-binding protein Fis
MPEAPPVPSRRIVVLSERFPAELANALSAAGLELRAGGDPSGPEVLLADPACLAGGEGLEEMVAARAGALLEKLGDTVPALHEAVLLQAERGLFKAVLAHTQNHLGRASKILGLDRNTCARKARAFGLVREPSRGRKPGALAARPARRKGAASDRPGKKTR